MKGGGRAALLARQQPSRGSSIVGRLSQVLFNRRVAAEQQRRQLCSSVRPTFTVHQRLAALSALQEETDALASLAEQEQLNIRRRLLAKTAALRDRRAAILAGEELTDDEAALEPVPDEEVPPSLEASLDSYWQEVLQRVLGRRDVVNDFDHQWLTITDLEVLKHLRDIQITCEAGTDDERPHATGQGSDDTLTLTFFFRPNEFMQPGHETLTISFTRVLGQLRSTSGCAIQWTAGRDPTKVVGADGQLEEAASFFAIFRPCDDFMFESGQSGGSEAELVGDDDDDDDDDGEEGGVGDGDGDGSGKMEQDTNDDDDDDDDDEEEEGDDEFRSPGEMHMRTELVDVTKRVVSELEEVALLNATAIVLSEPPDIGLEDEMGSEGIAGSAVQPGELSTATRIAAGADEDESYFDGYYDEEDEGEASSGSPAPRPGKGGGGACYLCGEMGHLARNCPSAANIGMGKGGGRGGGKGGWNGYGKGGASQYAHGKGGGGGWNDGGWGGGSAYGKGAGRGGGGDGWGGSSWDSGDGQWGGDGWGGGGKGGGGGGGKGFYAGGKGGGKGYAGGKGGGWEGGWGSDWPTAEGGSGGFGEMHPDGYVDYGMTDLPLEGKGFGGKGFGKGFGKGGAGMGRGGRGSGPRYDDQGNIHRKRYPPFVREEGDTAPVDVAEVERLLVQRNELRRLQDFEGADRVRDELKERLDVTIIDRDGENKWFVGNGAVDGAFSFNPRERGRGSGKGSASGGRTSDDLDEYYDDYDSFGGDAPSFGYGRGRGGGRGGKGGGFGKGFGKGGKGKGKGKGFGK